MDPPFRLPLTTEEHKGSTPVVLLHAPHKGGVEQLGCLHVYPSEPGRAKRQLDYIALCVNAHADLVAAVKGLLGTVDLLREVVERDCADWPFRGRECAEVNSAKDALALADPAADDQP